MRDPVSVFSDPSLGVVREVRPKQVGLAAYVHRRMEANAGSLIEASTGIGKSFTYLVNAVHVANQGKRVLISTAMKALQEQLISTDLPHIKRTLAPDLKYALLLGKGNYICRKRVETSPLLKRDQAKLLAAFDVAPQGIWDRIPAAFPLPVIYSKEPFSVDGCNGPKCHHYEDCFRNGYAGARAHAHDADIVVANHALVGAEVRGRARDYKSVFGTRNIDYLIVDEAHKFPEQLRAALTSEMPSNYLVKMQEALNASLTDMECDPRTLMMGLTDHIPRGIPDVQNLEAAFHNMHMEAQASRHKSEVLGPNAQAFAQAARKSVHGLMAACGVGTPSFWRLLNDPEGGTDELPPWMQSPALRTHAPALNALRHYGRIAMDLESLANAIDAARADKLRYVVTYDVPDKPHKPRELTIIPLDVDVRLKQYYEKAKITPIYMSATLGVGGDLTDFGQEVGLAVQVSDEYGVSWEMPEDSVYLAGTPFDMEKQAFAYYPQGLPVPPEYQAHASQIEAYTNAIGEECYQLLMANKGHAFVLFTSNHDMNAVGRYLERRRYPYPMRVQTTENKGTAKEWFVSTPNSTLLGVKTFWEGIDVPGHALSLVIIPKLPFPMKSDPIVQALCQRAGDHWFQQVSKPSMLINLRQMAGRLIRSTSDYGVVAILDGRIHTKNYGGEVRDAAGVPKYTTRRDVVLQLLEKYCVKRERAGYAPGKTAG